MRDHASENDPPECLMSMTLPSLPSPIVVLLEGVHYQRHDQVRDTMSRIRKVLAPSITPEERSARGLSDIIRLLMMHYPQLASAVNPEDKSIPLHPAASIGNVSIAKHLLTVYPEATCVGNKKGKIPLHFAAREGRAEMVRFLLSWNTSTAKTLSKKNKLALHFAAGEGHMDIVHQLLQLHPEGALQRSSKGKLPLHFAARWGHLDVARALLTLYPESVQSMDLEGSLPIHDAAREGQIAMVQHMLQLYPLGLMNATIRNEIPLFLAVRSGNLPLVVVLIQAFPAGGRFVLRHASMDDNLKNWSDDIIELLLRGAAGNFSGCSLVRGREAPIVCYASDAISCSGESSDDESQCSYGSQDCAGALSSKESATETKQPTNEVASVGRPTKRIRYSPPAPRRMVAIPGEFLPLSTALVCEATTDALRRVLDLYPNQLSRKDRWGRLPLHLAMCHCRGDDKKNRLVIDKILKPYPKAVGEKDINDNLPLHIGLMNKADFILIQALLESDPSSGFAQPGRSLKMGMMHDVDLSTLYTLVRGDPSVLPDLVVVKGHHDELT